MKIYCLTYARTGSHTFGRNLAASGYQVIHEPFMIDGYNNLSWPDDRNQLSKVIAEHDDIIVWDHAVSNQVIPKKDLHLFLNWIKSQVDIVVVLLRRDAFEWALSSIHLSKHKYFDDNEDRISICVDKEELDDILLDHRELSSRLCNLNFPIYYYEDLLNEENNFPVKMTSNDPFTIPLKSSYITNYEELKQQFIDEK